MSKSYNFFATIVGKKILTLIFWCWALIFSISKAVLFIDDEVFGVSLNVKFLVKAAFKSPDRTPDVSDFRALLRNECRRFDDILCLSHFSKIIFFSLLCFYLCFQNLPAYWAKEEHGNLIFVL